MTTIDIATTAHEKKTMAKTLLALPKSQIATMEELNAEVKALVAEGLSQPVVYKFIPSGVRYNRIRLKNRLLKF